MKRKWTKKDGTKTWIKDMDDDHLLNSMKLCHRFAWNEWNTAQWELARASMSIMSDNAMDCIDREMMRGWWEYLPYSYWDLLRYARKRKFWDSKLEKKFTVDGCLGIPQFNHMSPYWVCHHDETVAMNEDGHAGIYCVDCGKQLEDGC